MWPRFLLFPILVVLAYWPALQGGYLWDDQDYVARNELLRSADGLEKIWFEPGATPQYYPLVFTTFWIEYQLWSIDTMSYHLLNILLHGVNSVLFWLLLRRLRVPGAWLAAAIFALHPVHVESVAWITERKNVLSGFFYLCSFLAYLRFSPLASDSPLALRPSRLWYGVTLACFVAALLSKTVVCSLPAVLILVYWWKRGWPTRREWTALIPMFIVGAVLAWNTARIEKYYVGAQGPDFDFTPVERVLIAGRALWFYAAKLVWPQPLIFNYERWTIDAGDFRQYLFPIGVVAVFLVLLAGLRKVGRGPLVACLIFAGTLLPALGFFNVYPMRFSFVADHFQYLASMGLIALFVAGACHLGLKFWPRPAQGVAAGCLLLCLLGFLTWRQCHDYVDVETLWRNTLVKNPHAFVAYLNLGVARMEVSQYREANRYFEQATKANPKFVDAFNQWAICLVLQGHSSKKLAGKAETQAQQLKAVGREEESQRMKAEAKMLQQAARKKFTEAAEKSRLALNLEDDDPRRHNNLARIFIELEDYEAAVVEAKKALALAPHFERYNRRRFDFKKGYPQGEYTLGLALYELGRIQEALPHLRRAVELSPKSELYQETLEKAESKSPMHQQDAQGTLVP